ncbi:MAG: flagellar hook-associated protein FlgL [Granulosicoccus sp.]
MINTRVPSNLLITRIATDIVQKQNSLADVQEQISTGKKINRPSDSPAEAAHILTMNETTSRLEQYTKNSSIAESQLSLEEGALTGTTAALNRIRDLALRANSGLLNDGFRQDTSAEVKLKLDELYSLANSSDSFGNYLFSGSNIHKLPFKPGDPVVYSGSDETTKMDIALGRTIDTGDSGIDVFMRIRSGNGDFQVSSNPANVGTGSISSGAVADSSVFRGGEYEISFNSATSYDVIDLSSGTTIQSAVSFEPGGNIEIEGMVTGIFGAPVAGDTFKIEPSEYQDIFSTVSKLISALDETPNSASETARTRAEINKAMGEIDNALDHVNTMRSRVGTRLSSIESSREENENVALQIERTKRGVEDVDIADAVTRLQMQANSLEIIQKTFSRIEGLTLFNYM